MPVHPNTDPRAPSAIWRAGSWKTRWLVLILPMLSRPQCVMTAATVTRGDASWSGEDSQLQPFASKEEPHPKLAFTLVKLTSKALSQAYWCLCDHSSNFIHSHRAVHTKIPLQKAPTGTVCSLIECIRTPESTHLLHTTGRTAKQVGLQSLQVPALHFFYPADLYLVISKQTRFI